MDRSFLLLVGHVLLVGAIGYVLTMAVCWPVGELLRGVLPLYPLLLVVICAALPMWLFFSLVTWVVLFEISMRRRKAKEWKAFQRREPLTEEALRALFPRSAIAAEVRRELRRFVGHPEVVDRLLPSDLIRASCGLVGAYPDDLGWADFLAGLESQFGFGIPNVAFDDTTMVELVAWCEGSAEPAEPGAAPDTAR